MKLPTLLTPRKKKKKKKKKGGLKPKLESKPFFSLLLLLFMFLPWARVSHVYAMSFPQPFY